MNPANGGQYRFGVVSCIDHNDPINDLYVRWLIPGPHGWVPAHEKLESTPRLRLDVNAMQLDGCLQFGNRGDTTSGLFFGIDGDAQKAADDMRRGCRLAAGQTSPPAQPDPQAKRLIESLFFGIKNFFPSDTNKSQTTMLQLEGQVAVKPSSDTGYTSLFIYKLIPFRGSAGSPADIRLRPAFRGATASLRAAFFQKNPDTIKVGNEGTIFFEVSNVRNPQLDYLSYEFYDRDNRLVGSIDLPVFVTGVERRAQRE